jgi:hypothetical protein
MLDEVNDMLFITGDTEVSLVHRILKAPAFRRLGWTEVRALPDGVPTICIEGGCFDVEAFRFIHRSALAGQVSVPD